MTKKYEIPRVCTVSTRLDADEEEKFTKIIKKLKLSRSEANHKALVQFMSAMTEGKGE